MKCSTIPGWPTNTGYMCAEEPDKDNKCQAKHAVYTISGNRFVELTYLHYTKTYLFIKTNPITVKTIFYIF